MSQEIVARILGMAAHLEYVLSKVEELPEKERKVIRLRYGLEPKENPWTLEAIGMELGLTRERVRQVEWQALDRLWEML